MKKSALIIVLTVFALSSSAQYAKTRLWKISGNGLLKPSYLFGSMHVDDERVFNFSDSLFYKLAECDVFANEISNDSVIKFLYQTIDSKLQQRIEKEYFGVDEEVLDEISQSTGLDKVSLKKLSPVILKQLIPGMSGNTQRKPVVLDSYLYNIARREGKTCIGIENLNTQIKLFNQFSDSLRIKYTDFTIGKKRLTKDSRMVEIYRKADMEAVELLISQLPADLYKAVFTDRNYGMASQIDSISKLASAFYTIGIGHLPGKEGLIEILRSKGYAVEPVQETFTGLAEKFTFRNIEIPWVTYSDPKSGFQVDMPGQAYTSPNFPMGIMHGICFDIGTNSFYMALARSASIFGHIKDMDSLAIQFAQTAWKINPSKVRVTKIEHNGVEFRQADRLKMNQFNISFRVARERDIVYIIIALKSDENEMSDLNRFFDSFKFTDKVAENWSVFHSEKGAYEIEFPGSPKESVMTDVSDEENLTIVGLISGTDISTNHEFAVQFIDSKVNYYPNDTLVLSLIQNNMTTLKHTNLTAEKTMFGGFPALRFSFDLYNGQKMQVFSIVRGTRIYNLISGKATSDMDETPSDFFFNSFKLKDYDWLNWKPMISEVGHFSVLAPDSFTRTEDEYLNNPYVSSESYNSFDPITGDKVMVLRRVYSPFYQSNCDSVFFREFYLDETDDSDSVVSQTKLSDTPPSYQFVTMSASSHLVTRSKLILKGRSMYMLITRTPHIYQDISPVQQCVDSFSVSDTTTPGELTENKTIALLAGLSSADSLIQTQAYKALSFYSFSKDEIPLVWQRLQGTFSDDTLNFRSTRVLLMNSISNDLDSSYLEKIVNDFDALCPTNPSKLAALAVLTAGYDSAYRTFVKQQLISIPPNTIYKYRVLYLLNDSATYAKGFYPEILELLKDTLNRDDVIHLTADLLDKGLLTVAEIESYKPTIVLLLKELSTNPGQLYEGDYYTPKLFYVASYFNDPQINSLLIKNRNSTNRYIAYNVLKSSVRNNLGFRKKDMQRIASDPGLRRNLHDFLHESGKIQLMPAEFNTQSSIAESDLYEYLVYDDYQPESMTLKAEKELVYKGILQRFYLFSVTLNWEEGSDVSLYIAGPYPADNSIPLYVESLTGTYWSDDQELPADKHFKAFEEMIADPGQD
jgi:uncharacterized protein YbaP (TraB family)